MQRRKIIVTLGRDEYARLVQRASAEDRTADQQASWLLRRLLSRETTETTTGARLVAEESVAEVAAA